MKTFLPLVKTIKTVVLLVSFASFSTTVSAQNSELVFKSPSLITPANTALQKGAKYKFANVATGVDAVVEIFDMSSGSVVVNNIDVTNTGFDKAFQPELGINGTVASNKDWWVEFEITFYAANTNNKIFLASFQATSLDTDGDNGSLREYVVMEKINGVTLSNATSLTQTLLAPMTCGPNQDGTNTIGIDKQITGTTVQHNGIDTSATDLMAQSTYTNKSVIRVRYGAKTGNTSSSSAMRLNSLWFKGFSTLPVNLVDFKGTYTKPSASLTWTTANETGFSHFVVERSVNGVDFTNAAVVFANGNAGNALAKYGFKDNLSTFKVPVVYYRLKMVDVSGSFKYSDVVIIRLAQPENQTIAISTFPNPATNEIRVTIPANWQNDQLQYTIYSINGQQVKSTSGTGVQTQVINVSNLTEGNYVIRVSNGAETATQKFIKVK